MAISKQYQSDIEAILVKLYDNGGDYWNTPDKWLNVGSPFTIINSACLLSELGMDFRTRIEGNCSSDSKCMAEKWKVLTVAARCYLSLSYD
jgi:hypothetical protein